MRDREVIPGLILSTLKAALRSVHGEAVVAEEVSGYYVADEIQMTHRGMMIAIPEDEWVVFHDLTPVKLADVLVQLARSVSLPKLRKHPRGPKKPKAQKAERGQDQTFCHREDSQSASYMYKMTPPKGWVREVHCNTQEGLWTHVR